MMQILINFSFIGYGCWGVGRKPFKSDISALHLIIRPVLYFTIEEPLCNFVVSMYLEITLLLRVINDT